MKYQDPQFCGPAALTNALRCLGVRISIKRVRAACGGDPNGTDTPDMLAGISSLGFVGTDVNFKTRLEAYTWLSHALVLGPVVLAVDRWSHWVTAIGRCGDRFIIIDPTNTVRNMAENGVHVVSRAELTRRWYNRDKGLAHAIAVSKRR